MSATLLQKTLLGNPSPPTPFYAESPETSRQLFKAATTPSPRVKRRRREAARSNTPSPDESRSIHNTSSPSQRADVDDDDVFAPKRGSGEIPSGLGLGLGIPILPDDSVDEPVIAWRFSEVSKQSSVVSPSSPSPTESIAGDTYPPGDQYSIHTLTPGPAWPPPPSTDVSPEQTPRNSLEYQEDPFRRSGESGDFESMPLSPLTPAISHLLDEISTMQRPPSSNSSKPVTTVQAWVMDMQPMEMGRGRGDIRVRKMRSWRNLRALGTRTSQFELIRQAVDSRLPSPPITPPGQGEGETQSTQPVYLVNTTPSQLPDSPVESPFYDDYEDIIGDHLEPPIESDNQEDDDFDVESVQEIIPQQELETGLEGPESPRPNQSIQLDQRSHTPTQAVPESPAIRQESTNPVTPDPNSDLVLEIEALLKSSPLRKKEREEAAARDASNQTTPTQAKISSGTDEDLDKTPTQIQPPTFNRSGTQETLGSESSVGTVFYTPKEARTPFFEKPNPMETETIPPVPAEARPRTPPPKSALQTSSSQSTPTRPIVPQRRSSLSHSRNQSVETIPTKSYPPTAHRPPSHQRGKSIDSSSVYNDSRGRMNPPPPRQRSSSANAAGDESRGRVRSRSIDDGPPPIPTRKSSVGKTGRPTELLDSWLKKDSSGVSRPSLTSLIGDRKISDESVEQKHKSRFSFSSGVEILGVEQAAEVVSGGIVPRGSVKRVTVKTPTTGTKAAEFAEVIVASPTEDNTESKPRHIPQISFGEGPDLSLGEGTSASAGKGKERAKDQTIGPSSLPVLFQLIPPTPAALDGSATQSKQLGYQVAQTITIPSTPQPNTDINSDNILYVPIRKSTPTPAVAGNNVYTRAPPDSTPSIAFSIGLSPGQEPIERRPSTAPEPLIDFENTTPNLTPKRPSLKNRPTDFKKSKLSPWWKPKYEKHYSDHLSDDDYDYRDQPRPSTSTTITSVTSTGGKRRKAHKTVNLGKVQLEFIGVRGLRDSYREMREVKKRKKMAQQTTISKNPPRLQEVSFE